MRVKVILKNPAPNGVKEFEYVEQAILDDEMADHVALACGSVFGGRIDDPPYSFKECSHICYSWSDIDRLDVMQ